MGRKAAFWDWGKPPIPSNWDNIKTLREKGKFTLKANPLVKPEISFRGYQGVGIANMVMSNCLILADGAGLGKTLQVLASFAHLKNLQPSWKLLVVTQTSVFLQWGKEVEKFLNGVSYHCVLNAYKPAGSNRKLTSVAARKAQYEDFKGVDIMVVTYATLRTDFALLSKARDTEDLMVVFDECQEFKNKKSMNYAAAEQLVSKAKRVYGLSATPIKNRLTEFYYLYKIVAPFLFPGITKFKEQYANVDIEYIPAGGGKYKRIEKITGYKNLEHFRDWIEPYFLLRLTSEVASELPTIVSKILKVELTAQQKRLYKEAKAGITWKEKLKQKYFDYVEFYESLPEPTDVQDQTMEEYQAMYDSVLDGTLKNIKATALAYCQMVVNTPVILGEEGPSGKITELKRFMEDELEDVKTIIYTRFASGIPEIQKALKAIGKDSVIIAGGMSPAERTHSAETFQDPDSGVDVIIITNAGSAGVNLQKAGCLIFFDTPWSYGDLYQIIGRAQRIGSEHENVLVAYLVAPSTIDEHVLELLKAKKNLNDEVLGDTAVGALEFEGIGELKGASREDLLSMSEADILFASLSEDL